VFELEDAQIDCQPELSVLNREPLIETGKIWECLAKTILRGSEADGLHALC
jgi:hypothetical protein